LTAKEFVRLVLSRKGLFRSLAEKDETAEEGLEDLEDLEEQVTTLSNTVNTLNGQVEDIDTQVQNIATNIQALEDIAYGYPKVFVDSKTGTGEAQQISHGLGAVPDLVVVVPTSFTIGDSGGSVSIQQGQHTDTQLVVTVSNGVGYQVVAFKFPEAPEE